MTVNTSSGGPNVILKKGLCGSRAAFAKVTRSKWLLGLLWAAAGLGVRAGELHASAHAPSSSVVLRSVGLRAASFSLC